MDQLLEGFLALIRLENKSKIKELGYWSYGSSREYENAESGILNLEKLYGRWR